ncbi:MAG: hypothetical protein JRJ51_20195 [Deltaproteobacteria bacterium]|nr:hypothetical protein [Deltaproteobacteria bacterium]
MADHQKGKINGMFLVVERKNDRGLRHWADELQRRHIPAVILADEYTLDNHLDLLKDIAGAGFEIGLVYNDNPFWDDPYDTQHDIMTRIKGNVQSCLDRPLRVFGSKYFAYNEDTLKIADKLGIEYILARGTAGARAMVYKAEEYGPKIISVSNVPSKDLGTGSLCDESLRCRGEAPEGLKKLLDNLKEDRIILVAQTHVSGVKLHWWNVYQEFFDQEIITWQSIDEFATDTMVLPNAQIPINDRTDYRTPKPRMPLEEEPDFPFE